MSGMKFAMVLKLFFIRCILMVKKSFLKGYTIPFIQFDPLKTILVFSHEHNTFDKRTLLEGGWNKFMKKSDKTIDMFIKEPELKEFYLNQIEKLLIDYDPGKPEMKPDVLKQIAEIKVEREKQSKQMQQQICLNDHLGVVWHDDCS